MYYIYVIYILFMIWTGTEEELLKFINEINQKTKKTIKFDFKYSKTKIKNFKMF